MGQSAKCIGDSGQGPEFAPSAGLRLGRDSNPHVAFRGKSRLLSESNADGFRTYEKHPWDVPPRREGQVTELQGGLVWSLFQLARRHTQNTVIHTHYILHVSVRTPTCVCLT